MAAACRLDLRQALLLPPPSPQLLWPHLDSGPGAGVRNRARCPKKRGSLTPSPTKALRGP